MTSAARDVQLSKKLSWLLRHSTPSQRQAAQAFRGGYYILSEIQAKFRDVSPEELLALLAKSKSPTSGENRFEVKNVGGVDYVRATYGHSFDVSKGREIPLKPTLPSLEDLCLKVILANLKRFDSFYGLLKNDVLAKFTDLLKSSGKVTAKNLALVLVPELTSLDLSNTFVSDGILRTICRQCTGLTALNLAGAYSTVTDANLAMLCKALTRLEDLNLAACNRVSDAGVKSIAKLASLKYLNLSDCPLLTDATLKLLAEHSSLEVLDVRKVSSFSTEAVNIFLANKLDGLLSSIDSPLFYDSQTGVFQPLSTVAEGFEFTHKGKTWPTSHHYYQAMKFEGTPLEEGIRLARTPKLAQKMGRAEGTQPRDGWDDMRLEVWVEGNLEKFRQNRRIRQMLLDTGDRRLCWNSADEFWGGRYPHCKNHCGDCLMQIRDILRREEAARTKLIEENEEHLRRTRNGALLDD